MDENRMPENGAPQEQPYQQQYDPQMQLYQQQYDPQTQQYQQQYDPQMQQYPPQQYDPQLQQYDPRMYEQQPYQQPYAPAAPKQKKGLIIGMIVGFAVLLSVIAMLVWFLLQKPKAETAKEKPAATEAVSHVVPAETDAPEVPETKAPETDAPRDFYCDLHVAFVTDVGNIDDHSFNQATYEGVCEFADLTGCECSYYKPSEDTDQARVDAMVQAICDGYDTIVVAGYLFGPALNVCALDYPDVNFLALDVTWGDLGADEIPENICLVTYLEEQAGFLAGYAAVMDGYTELGFLGGMDVPAVVRYGYGFLQGADQAAAELGVSIHVKYWYSGSFAPMDEITSRMDTWYVEGTEVVFCCGGGIFISCLSAADADEGRLIGVDVDQTYDSDRFVTSAMKGLSESAVLMLTELAENNGSWPEYSGGRQICLGVDEGCVKLPMDTSRFDFFSMSDYEVLYEKLASGEYYADTYDSDPDEHPILANVKVDWQ